ncbi:MAG: hypothetical protein NTY53_25215, partial [Kiritimatiellaeota bacterium]|nr:hypothetical protein [Kiritimatiellota bacterium]
MKITNGKNVGLALLWLAGAGWADEVQTYRTIKDWTPYFGGEVGQVYVTPSYEYSSIHLGQNQVDWHVADVQLAMPLKSATPYV